jgi:hypothetical protein
MAGANAQVFVMHGEFRREIPVPHNRHNVVFASICEVDGNDVPFLGLAICRIDNVVPQDNGRVLVRGDVKWDRDIRVRISVFVP